MAIYERMRAITGDEEPTWEEQHTFVAIPAGQSTKDRMDAIEMISSNPGEKAATLAGAFAKAKRQEYAQFPQVRQSIMGGGDPVW